MSVSANSDVTAAMRLARADFPRDPLAEDCEVPRTAGADELAIYPVSSMLLPLFDFVTIVVNSIFLSPSFPCKNKKPGANARLFGS